jgi:putative transposase
MPRRNRNQILYDGCFAHIYSRALQGQFIFENRNDFNYFKSLLLRTKEKNHYRIHHYCLMNTHFHLVIQLESLDDFSHGMKALKQDYVKWMQNEKQYTGPAWWGRFGSQLIMDEKYLYACGLYIEYNPVKAEMVRKPEQWLYSSSRHYFTGKKDEIIDAYEKPKKEEVNNLLQDLNVGRGPVLGSLLDQIHAKEIL